MFAHGLTPSTALTAASHAIRGGRLELAKVPLAPTEALWLGVIGGLVLLWLVLCTLAGGEGANNAPICAIHGRAALVCRQDTAAPVADTPNLVCASFGRGGRVCSGRP